MNEERPKVGVGILVVKESAGKTFIMLHQRRGTLGKDYWGSGGGHIEMGESLEEAALRELEEEAGEQLLVTNVRFLGVVNFTQLQPKHYVDISFIASWVSGDPKNSSPRETSEWEWFDIEKLPLPLFPPVEKYIESIRSGRNFFDSKFN